MPRRSAPTSPSRLESTFVPQGPVQARSPLPWLLRGTSALSAAVLAGGVLVGGVGYALAGPTGAKVVAGKATITQTGPKTIVINQQSGKVIIEWKNFNIGKGEKVIFAQPNAVSAALNRVLSGDKTSILGSLTANGQIIITNPKGIVFGPSARVDVASIIASSIGITNDNFLAGRMIFDQPGDPGAMVSNHGTITVAQGGLAALVAPGVENTGTITARLGTVALASGTKATLDFYGDGLVQIAIDAPVEQVPVGEDGQPVKALVNNTGSIFADGGTVVLTAEAAEGVLDRVINVEGVVQARSIEDRQGQVALVGGSTGEVQVAGTVDASGTDAGQTGGTVHVLGEKVTLADGAAIDVSGDKGGGTVLIGGDTKGGSLVRSSGLAYKAPKAGKAGTTVVLSKALATDGYIPKAQIAYVDAGASAKADAISSGKGGKVVVWADQATEFHGSASVQGAGSGKGGFVETSARSVSVSGAQIALGDGGSWLLDPTDDFIDAADWVAIQGALNDPGDQTVTRTTAGPGADAGDIFFEISGNLTGMESGDTLNLVAFRLFGQGNTVTMDNGILNINIADASVIGAQPSTAEHGTGLIQRAIDAVAFGNAATTTINVGAGTFDDTVTINKALTLNGIQAGVDPTSGRSGAESIIRPLFEDTATVHVVADDVTIDGFTILKEGKFDDETGTPTTLWGIDNRSLLVVEDVLTDVVAQAIPLGGYVAIDDLHVLNNIISGVGLDDGDDTGGVQLSVAGIPTFTMFDNVIQRNVIDSVGEVGIAIYNNRDFFIADNVVKGTVPDPTLNGIYIGTPTVSFSLGDIVGNDLRGVGAGTGSSTPGALVQAVDNAGIIVGPYDQVNIVENLIRGYTYGIWILSPEAYPGQIDSYGSEGVRIFNNSIAGRFRQDGTVAPVTDLQTNQWAIRVDSDFYGLLPDPHNGVIGPLNASGNWWGTTDQDDIARVMVACAFDCGVTVGAGDFDMDPIRANLYITPVVDFSPYLHTGIDTNVSYVEDVGGILIGLGELDYGQDAHGFQGDFTSVHTTLLGAQTPINIEDLEEQLEPVLEAFGLYDGYDGGEGCYGSSCYVPLGRIQEGVIMALSPADTLATTGRVIVEGIPDLTGDAATGRAELSPFLQLQTEGTRTFVIDGKSTPLGDPAYVDPFVIVYKSNLRILAASNGSLTQVGVGNAPPLTYAPIGYPGRTNAIGQTYPATTGEQLANANNPLPHDADGRGPESIMFGTFVILPHMEITVEGRQELIKAAAAETSGHTQFTRVGLADGPEGQIHIELDGTNTEINGMQIRNIGDLSHNLPFTSSSQAALDIGGGDIDDLLSQLGQDSIAGILAIGSAGHTFANNIIDGAIYDYQFDFPDGPEGPPIITKTVAKNAFGSGIWLLHGGADTLILRNDIRNWGSTQFGLQGTGGGGGLTDGAAQVSGIEGVLEELLFHFGPVLSDNGGIKVTNFSASDIHFINELADFVIDEDPNYDFEMTRTNLHFEYSGESEPDFVLDIDFAPAEDVVISQNTLQYNRKGMIFENVGDPTETDGGLAAAIFENWIWDSTGGTGVFSGGTPGGGGNLLDPNDLFAAATAIQINFHAAFSSLPGPVTLASAAQEELPFGGESGTFLINENSFDNVIAETPLAIVNLGNGEVTDGGGAKPNVGNWFGTNNLAAVQAMLVGNVTISDDPFRLFPSGIDAHPEIPGWQFPESPSVPPVIPPGGTTGFVLDPNDILYKPPFLGVGPDTPGDAWYRWSAVNLEYPTDPLAGGYSLGGTGGTGGPETLEPAAGGEGQQGTDNCGNQFLGDMNASCAQP